MTGNVCVVNGASLFVLIFVETTASTAVAKGFPLAPSHLGEGFRLPEWYVFGLSSHGDYAAS